MTDMPLTESEKLGYWFSPKAYPHAPGYPRLDVTLHTTPSETPFDPERVTLSVAGKTDPAIPVETLRVYSDWRGGPRHRVCAGPVRLADRRGDVVQAFTYGGEVTLHADDTMTALTLTSPVPILHIDPVHVQSTADLLADETQVLLAERRAVWSREKPGEFERRLANVDPLTLYQTCIAAIGERFQPSPRYEGESIVAFEYFLEAEAQRLLALIKKSPYPLEEIL